MFVTQQASDSSDQTQMNRKRAIASEFVLIESNMTSVNTTLRTQFIVFCWISKKMLVGYFKIPRDNVRTEVNAPNKNKAVF